MFTYLRLLVLIWHAKYVHLFLIVRQVIDNYLAWMEQAKYVPLSVQFYLEHIASIVDLGLEKLNTIVGLLHVRM